MTIKKYIYLAAALVLLGGFILSAPVFAQGQGGRANQGKITNRLPQTAVIGTVSAISGKSITISGRQGLDSKIAAKTFTVDATNAKVIKNGAAGTLSDIVLGDIIFVQGTISGTNITAVTIRDGISQGPMDSNRMNPSVVGKVSAISGNTLTVISERKNEQSSTSNTTTYTVDATNAKILRGETAIKVSDIAVGDNIIVQGTVTGSNVSATTIRDGKVGNGKNDQGDNNQALLQIQGNGQPIVAGTVSAVSGNTITITNSSNITYTIDAANAKFVQGKNTIMLSNIKTGDSVVVQGTVNGTSIIASTIIDQRKPENSKPQPAPKKAFFSSIGKFFSRMFGF